MFLKKLYYQWRTAFYLVIIMVVVQLFFMFKQVETIPFFLFNMYSTRQEEKDTTLRTRIVIGGKELNTRSLTGREREMILGSYAWFRKLEANDFYATDTHTIRKRLGKILPPSWYASAVNRLSNPQVSHQSYFNWMCRYLSQITGKRTDSIRIFRSSVIWRPSIIFLNDTNFLIRYVPE